MVAEGVVRKRPVLASGSVVRVAITAPIITGRYMNSSRNAHPGARQHEGNSSLRLGRGGAVMMFGQVVRFPRPGSGLGPSTRF